MPRYRILMDYNSENFGGMASDPIAAVITEIKNKLAANGSYQVDHSKVIIKGISVLDDAPALDISHD